MKNDFLLRMEKLRKNLEAVKRNFPIEEVHNDAVEYHEDHGYHHDQPDLEYNRAMWEDHDDEEYDGLNKAEDISLKPPKKLKEPKAVKTARFTVAPKEILNEHKKDRSFITATIDEKLDSLKNQLERHLDHGDGDEALIKKVERYKPEFRHDKDKGRYVHLGNKSAVFRDVLDEVYADHGPKFHPKIGVSNSKLENEAIATWSIPEKDFCPGAGDCIKGCYVNHGPMGWNTAAISRWINAYAAKNDHFVPTMNKLLGQFNKAAPVTTKDWHNIKEVRHKEDSNGNKKFKKGKPVMETIYHDRTDDKGSAIKHDWTHFRIHDSGDFHSDEYTSKWGDIIKSNPHIHFYAYSKTLNESKKKGLETRTAHRQLRALHDQGKNFNLRQSLGGLHDADIDPSRPHAVIFPDHEARKLAGYDDISDYDKASSNRDMIKGGLVYHGPKKDYDFKRHISRSPKLKEQLAHVLEDYEKRQAEAEAQIPLKKRSKPKKNDKLESSETARLLLKSLISKIKQPT